MRFELYSLRTGYTRIRTHAFALKCFYFFWSLAYICLYDNINLHVYIPPGFATKRTAFDTSFLSQINYLSKTVKCRQVTLGYDVHGTRSWAFHPRVPMTSTFHLSHGNSVINSLIFAMAYVCLNIIFNLSYRRFPFARVDGGEVCNMSYFP